MPQPALGNLGRRERQIVEAVYRAGRATVNDVLSGLPDPPSYSAVRAMLGKLEKKGYVKHEAEGTRYVYLPVFSTQRARKNALTHLVDTFFDGSAEQAVLALIRLSDTTLPPDMLERLADHVKAAKKEGR